jgi:hypothetical protein
VTDPIFQFGKTTAKSYETFKEISEKFGQFSKKCMKEFESYVNTTGDINKVIPPDATVHELTSNVCSFFKRLFPFQDSIDIIMKTDSTPLPSAFFATFLCIYTSSLLINS